MAIAAGHFFGRNVNVPVMIIAIGRRCKFQPPQRNSPL